MLAAATHPFLGLHDPDLIAIGGLGAFIATIILAVVATRQAGASLAANVAVREAARAQLQPLVFGRLRSPDEATSFTYRISNQGTGPALDIEHGIIIDGGVEISSPRVRSLRVEENHRITIQIPADAHIVSSFARFSNVFGERFEIVNPADRNIAATLRRLTGA